MKSGATTDLTEQGDKVLGALNLVRYLLLFPPTVSLIISEMGKVEDLLLKPLRTALDFSRAHYTQKLKELSNPRTAQELILQEQQELLKESSKMEDLMINDESAIESIKTAGSISIPQRILAVNSSINLFDMMDSVLARVNECYRFQQKSFSAENV